MLLVEIWIVLQLACVYTTLEHANRQLTNRTNTGRSTWFDSLNLMRTSRRWTNRGFRMTDCLTHSIGAHKQEEVLIPSKRSTPCLPDCLKHYQHQTSKPLSSPWWLNKGQLLLFGFHYQQPKHRWQWAAFISNSISKCNAWDNIRQESLYPVIDFLNQSSPLAASRPTIIIVGSVFTARSIQFKLASVEQDDFL